MKILWDAETITLVRAIHGITGKLKSGASQGLLNYTTFVRLLSIRKAEHNELTLWNVSEILRQRQQPLIATVPEIYPFTVGRGNLLRSVAAIHGIVDVRYGHRVEQEYRFVVVFKHEIEPVLRQIFKLDGSTARQAASEVAA